MKKAIAIISITLIIIGMLAGCSSSQYEEKIASLEQEKSELITKNDSLQQEIDKLKEENETLKQASLEEEQKKEIPEPETISANNENLQVLFNGEYIKTHNTPESAKASPVSVEAPRDPEEYYFVASGITLNNIVVTGAAVDLDGMTMFDGYQEVSFDHLGNNKYEFSHHTIPVVSDRTFQIESVNGKSKYFTLHFE